MGEHGCLAVLLRAAKVSCSITSYTQLPAPSLACTQTRPDRLLANVWLQLAGVAAARTPQHAQPNRRLLRAHLGAAFC